MDYVLYLLIILVVIQTFINIYLINELKREKRDIKDINSNLNKSATLIKYLMDRLKGRDKINMN